MKVALIQCPQWDLELPPLNLAYLSAYLKKEKHDVKIFDFNIGLFHEGGKNNKKYWKVSFELDGNWRNLKKINEMGMINGQILDKWVYHVLKWKPRVIGFTISMNTKIVSLMLAKKIKEANPDVVIIFGGEECTKYTSGLELVKNNSIDIVIHGEGELALSQIVERIDDGEQVDNIPGVLLYRNNQIIDYGYSKFIPNLDEIPFPDFDTLPLDKYLNKKALPMLTSRGCINNCVYCNDRIFWKVYRFRTAENIFAEMKHQKKRYERNFFFFNDSLLNGNIKELERLSDIIIESGEEVNWLGNACIRKEMTPKLLKKMKNAGCKALIYGVESGSDKILKRMRRSYDVKTAEKVLRDTSKAGILTVTNWILGFPDETKTDFLKTLHFIHKNKKYIKVSRPGGAPFVVLASTDLEKNYKDFGIALNNIGPTWVSEDGTNTYEMREKKAKMLRLLVKRLNMST